MEDRAIRLNMLVDFGVAAIFAIALGTALYWIFSALGFDTGVELAAICAGVLTFLLTAEVMRRVGPGIQRMPMQAFVPQPIVALEPDELLLTDRAGTEELLLTDRRGAEELLLTDVHQPQDPIRQAGELLLSQVYRPQSPQVDELLLDDILREIGPESRVVRLFDPSRIPSAGELQANIDRHLSTAARAAPEAESFPDDSQALHDALAELKRSLR